MSDRQVKIIVAADVSSAIRGLAQVQSGLGQVGQAGSQASSQAESFGDKLKQGLEVAGVTLGLAGVAAAIGKTISIGASFQDNLNQLRAVSGATATEMGAVSDRARELGNDLDLPTTSASDAAEAMLELSKGGLTVKESMDAAKGTLLLAAAAQISGAQAAEIQSAALNAFGLEADQANRVANVLANTANASAGSIEDFASGMQQSATVANQFGISIEDTATVLGLFANAGIKGSDAGTSFKTALLALASPTKQQQQALAELGVTVYDANGKFVGMRAVTEQLAAASQSLTQEQFNSAASTAFGADAMRGASVLANAAAGGYDAMRESVSRANGVQDVAAAQTQGLSGQLGKLQSAAEDVALSLFDNFSPALESGTGFATTLVGVIGDVVGWFAELPGPVQAAALSLGGVLALSGPLNALWLSLVARLAAAKAAMITFAATMRASVGSMAAAGAAAAGLGRGLLAAFGGPIGIAIAAGATALAFFAGSSDEAAGSTANFTGAVDENTGALSANAPAVIAAASASSGAFAAYKAIGGSVKEYTDALMGNTTAQDAVHTRILNSAQAALEGSGAWQRMVDKGVELASNSREVASGLLASGDAGQYSSQGMDAAMNASKLFASETDILGTNVEQTNDVLAATGGVTADVGAAAAGAAPEVANLGEALKAATENASLMASLTEGARQLSAVSAAASDASRALDLFKIAQDELDGRARSLDDALVAQEATLAALASAWEDGTAAATENKEAGDLNTQALLDWNVAALASTEDGRKLYGELGNLADQHLATTEAAYSNAIAEGNVAGAAGVARGQATASREAFIKLAAQYMGGNIPAAVQLADKLGILDGTQIDDKVFDTINQDAEAQRKLREAQAAEIANKSFDVTANDNATPTMNRISQYQINDKTYTIRAITVGGETQYDNGSGLIAREDGGVVHAAAGRIVAGRGRSTVMDGSGPGLTWAEAATNKEYYLSMKSGMESRNRALASMAVSDLGGQASWGRAGDVRAGTFSASSASVSGGPINVTLTLRGDGPIMDAAISGATAVVDGALRNVALTINRAGGQS